MPFDRSLQNYRATASAATYFDRQAMGLPYKIEIKQSECNPLFPLTLFARIAEKPSALK
jgi:hypothetical protein